MKLRSLVLAAFLALRFASFAQVGVSVNIAPPPLPVYEQPACPVEGYIWTPGYWAWDNDYYWVPGVWVPPPRVGLLWTPGWWGWSNGAYLFNQGYWGPTVGFYGGINYGYGYTGNGYWGGRWSGNTFQYNTAVTHVNKSVINNTYVNNSFAKNVNASRTSFNGGNGGIKAEPSAEQRAAMTNARKEGPTSQQLARQQAASKDQNLRASVNKGKPNQEAIKSFNRAEGKSAQEIGAAGAGAGNKPRNLSERQGQGAGRPENNRADMAERTRQGAAARPEANANKLKTENQRNGQNMVGNQAKLHTGNAAAGRGQSAMNQQKMKQMGAGQYRQPQMGGAQYQQQK